MVLLVGRRWAIDGRQGGGIGLCACWVPSPFGRANQYGRGSMAVRKIDKPEWRAFFDWLSQGLLGAGAEIEGASLDADDGPRLSCGAGSSRPGERHYAAIDGDKNLI